MNHKLADDIAAASADYGSRELANWIPAERHDALRELLYDLTISALTAFADVDMWRIPQPSEN